MHYFNLLGTSALYCIRLARPSQFLQAKNGGSKLGENLYPTTRSGCSGRRLGIPPRQNGLRDLVRQRRGLKQGLLSRFLALANQLALEL